MFIFDMRNIGFIHCFYSAIILTVFGAREPPMVTIPDQGILMGTYISMFRTQRAVAYLGIPYALPPIDNFRFTPPVIDPPPSWEGIRNATRLGPDCWQNTQRTVKKHDEMFQDLLPMQDDSEKQYDEDCLFLNVYIPDGPPPTDGYAVMVWIHSGDFVRGSPSLLDPFQLVFKQKLIVVTISYRLNIFGFFTTIDGEAPGNFGLMDQSAALQWVQRNIKIFGGNKDSVCLFGHGAGSVSVGLHLISGEWSENTFQRAIAMSGNIFSTSVISEPSVHISTLDRVAYLFGCFRYPTSKLISCLRNVPAFSLMEQAEKLANWGPIFDGVINSNSTPFLSDTPRNLFERGQFAKVPILTGYTDMENVLELINEDINESGISPSVFESLVSDTVVYDLMQKDNNDSCSLNQQHVVDTVSFFYKPQPPEKNPNVLRKRYVDFATEKDFGAPTYLMASLMGPHVTTYVYRFDLKLQTLAAAKDLPKWVGVPHKFDLIFVWGLPYWVPLQDGVPWESADKRVSDLIMILWANFAKFANPTQFGLYIKWDPFTLDAPGVLVIDRNFNMSDPKTLNYKAIEFWNEYYPKVLEMTHLCCNETNGVRSIVPATIHRLSIITCCFIVLQLFISATTSTATVT